MQWIGYRRISLEGAKTCLNCFGKGYVLNNPQSKYDL